MTPIVGIVVHVTCGQPLTVVTRTIITQPDDQSWPRDCAPGVFYCETCKNVIDVREAYLP